MDATDYVKVFYSKAKQILVTVEKVKITSEFALDYEMEEEIAIYETAMKEKLDKVVGYVDVDLDGRST